jgi:hypothetical protein
MVAYSSLLGRALANAAGKATLADFLQLLREEKERQLTPPRSSP